MISATDCLVVSECGGGHRIGRKKNERFPCDATAVAILLPPPPVPTIVAMSEAGERPSVLDVAERSTLMTRSCREQLQHEWDTVERPAEKFQRVEIAAEFHVAGSIATVPESIWYPSGEVASSKSFAQVVPDPSTASSTAAGNWMNRRTKGSTRTNSS